MDLAEWRSSLNESLSLSSRSLSALSSFMYWSREAISEIFSSIVGSRSPAGFSALGIVVSRPTKASVP